MQASRSVCWIPTWSATHPGVGLEHLLLRDGSADGVVLAVDDVHGPFRLAYRMTWDAQWRLHAADVVVERSGARHALRLRTDGAGRWHDGEHRALPALDGCIDIDLWPTPFTNSFPLLRAPLAVGERRTFRMAWVDGLAPSVSPRAQAYTRKAAGTYLFESLEGDGFRAELAVDAQGLVVDYPGLFRRLEWRA